MKSFRGWKTERKCIMQNTTTLNFYCTERPPDRGALFLFIYLFIITPDGSQTYSYTNMTQLYKN